MTASVTATLSDFLMACFAEDEAAAREQQRINAARYPLRWTWQPGPDLGGLLGVDPARVLAECEAKRRIVEGWLYLDADPETRMQAWTFALRCLALPYAEHPDYREEWRL